MNKLSILALALMSACSWSIAAREPKPAVKVAGPGSLALALGKDVPDAFTLSDVTATEVHQTLTNAFNAAFATVQAKDADYVLELQRLELASEMGGSGSVNALHYAASLREAKSGTVVKTTTGKAFPKDASANQWQMYDSTYAVLFEKIARELIPDGALAAVAPPPPPAPVVVAEEPAPEPTPAPVVVEKHPSAKKKQKKTAKR
jgi:hypothetical protein